FGSISWLPLYVKPLSVSSFLAAVGLYSAIVLAWAFTAGLLTQFGNRPLRPTASAGGAEPYSPSFGAGVRSVGRLIALRSTGRLYGYTLVSSMSPIGYAVVA